MKKSALTVTVGVLLILYGLVNFGAGMGQFSKAKMVSGTSSMAANLGEKAGDSAGAAKVRHEGASASSVLYLIALFILVTAVLDIVASIGLFSGNRWVFGMLILAAICGIIVEIQDTAEDGFGVGKFIFFAINLLALITAFAARDERIEAPN
ncbi:MAG: hypothetical protein ACOWYE_09830 [Desulfatiglandales bacterium]